MKTKTSKIISLLIAVIMICVMIPAGAFTVSAKDYTPEELYTYNNAIWGVTITGVTDKFAGGDVVLPTTIAGLNIDYINPLVFANRTDITSVTIPGSISIAYDAFSGCTGIKKVTFGKDVLYIDSSVFSDCTELETITVENGNSLYQSVNNCVIEDGLLVFGCKTSIIPDDGSVKCIAYGAFQGCKGLKSITIPNSVEEINGYAFYGCENLESIVIPDSVTFIGGSAFTNCSNLKSIKLSSNIEYLNYYSFANCTSLTSIDIPNSVTSIVYGVFSGCKNITKVGLPTSVTSIGSDAFDQCSKLSDVYYAGTKNQKEKIAIGEGSELLNATWHYESKLPEEIKPSEPASDKQPKPGVVDPEDAKVDYKTDKGIKISDNKAFAAGTVVTAKQLTNGAIFEKAAAAMQGVSSKYQVFEFDATLGGATVQPNGKITVTFDLPEGYNADKLGMFYVKDGKIAEQIKINVDKANKTVTAELEHFSAYVLAEVTSSKTWDYGSLNESNNGNYGIYVLFAGLILAAFAVTALNKRKCK